MEAGWGRCHGTEPIERVLGKHELFTPVSGSGNGKGWTTPLDANSRSPWVGPVIVPGLVSLWFWWDRASTMPWLWSSGPGWDTSQDTGLLVNLVQPREVDNLDWAVLLSSVAHTPRQCCPT